MVKKIVLLDKMHVIYPRMPIKEKNYVLARYEKYLRETVKGFPDTEVSIKKLREFDNRFDLTIEGPEEVFVYNLLKKEIGIITEFQDVKIGQVYKGLMTDVGKIGFGIFVDCGILNPNVDVLINLHTLREQLSGGRKLSVRDIIRIYGFIDNFPVYVKIKDFEQNNQKLLGELDIKTLVLFKKLVDEGLDAVFMTGETKGQFKKALIGAGHLRDIISIERFSFFENIVVLKENTSGPGIISKIGKQLNNCKLKAIRSEKIKKVW